ncbi:MULTISPECIES: acyl carrier protein [Kitasatospora]|uniref:Carrier domain-containing protein n=1 Tax=Kitasatospora setae (strain ATCC 33774 / DSM 43861 / JCM 3304 / KCC A-0304 / NBRC 14216 / KM-6054) TaxID=452652 RepID=E4NBH9_KITSK|nr:MULTISPECIES: acyl carrier protein [Kitasatospora]BAJ28560.1 hypothetical protein KSE_27480 [Kitasatospora setae KM-6054]
MTASRPLPGDQAETEIRGWLIDRLSESLSRPRHEINPDMPFIECGLDSVAALSLFGDIEEKFGLYLEPAIAWEYHPTVTAMAAYLASEAGASA